MMSIRKLSLLLISAWFADSSEEVSGLRYDEDINSYRLLLVEGQVIGDYQLDKRVSILGLSTVYSRDSASRSRDSHSLGASAEKVWDVESGFSLTTLSTAADSSPEKPSGPIEISELADEPATATGSTSCIDTGEFCLNENIFRGGHGEVWRAYKRSVPGTSYILKRMNIRDRPAIEMCAKREIYFGSSQRSRGSDRIARYETYFIIGDDYWLVFIDEGNSRVYSCDNLMGLFHKSRYSACT